MFTFAPLLQIPAIRFIGFANQRSIIGALVVKSNVYCIKKKR
jgi:hypothetical protein